MLFRRYVLSILAGISGLMPGEVRAAPPLTYLVGHGQKAAPVVSLTWGVTAISVAVIAIITFLLIGAVWRRGRAVWSPGQRLDIIDTAGGQSWIWIGTGISTLVLLAACIWTMIVLVQVEAAPRPAPYTIEIIGHQWWWEVHYLGNQGSRNFTTANEIHIPTGTPVSFKLSSVDVIHSFWIPQLSGKTDTIPGQVNRLWLDAQKPGTYYGQCTEYCGVQHAKMRMLMIAQPPHEFQHWWNHQLELATQPASSEARGGADLFVVHCGSCHTVRGTSAAGVFGPDLSHLMTRTTIAAGILSNTTGNLSGWIADPQEIKPGCLMPKLELSGPELADIRAYLQTLK